MKSRRMLGAACLAAVSVQIWAQSPAPAGPTLTNAPAPAASTDDLKQLKERIAQQEEAIKKLQDALKQQQRILDQAVAAEAAQEQKASAVVPSAGSPAIVPVSNVMPVSMTRTSQKTETVPAPSPLSITIGNTTFTPLGFVDATFFARSTNVGSGIGTNFAGIPFTNAVAGHLSETNFSAQNSRIGLRIDSNLLGWKVLGYLETDFLFNNNANSFQITSNSAGLRLRNYFVDTSKGKFEFLAGQDWSMLTPNRKGLSPLPSDIFYTQDMDTNYQLGLVWSRDPQFRFMYHANDHLTMGISLENPQQYLGGGNGSGAAVLPTNLNAVPAIAAEFNSNQSSTAVPNWFPDIVAKIAFDGGSENHAAHLEIAGVTGGFKDYIPAGTAGPAVVGTHTATSFGGEINSNFELFKNFRLVENAYTSDGGGRWLFGSAPDFVIRSNGDISPIHSSSTVDGFEAQVTKNTLLAAYYGGIWIQRNLTQDSTSKLAYVGYGYPGSGGTQNRSVQEITFEWIQTLWKNKNYGALSLINQYSYLFREPWYWNALTGPSKAHTNMVWVNVRYTLP